MPHAESLLLERDVGLHIDRERVGRQWDVRPAEEEERPGGDREVARATLNRTHHGPLPSLDPLADAPAHPKRAKWKGTGGTDDAASFACVDPTP